MGNPVFILDICVHEHICYELPEHLISDYINNVERQIVQKIWEKTA